MARCKKNSRGYLRRTFTYNGKRYEVVGKNERELDTKMNKRREEVEKGIECVISPTLNAYYARLTDIRRRELRGSTLRA